MKEHYICEVSLHGDNFLVSKPHIGNNMDTNTMAKAKVFTVPSCTPMVKMHLYRYMCTCHIGWVYIWFSNANDTRVRNYMWGNSVMQYLVVKTLKGAYQTALPWVRHTTAASRSVWSALTSISSLGYQDFTSLSIWKPFRGKYVYLLPLYPSILPLWNIVNA